jgi:hypothetical protein
MSKRILCVWGLLSLCFTVFGQGSSNKIVFVIDSIPLMNDPEEWNQLLSGDIADYSIIRQKDSLKLLGWEKVDGITYIFTKEYRKRPDSLKRIPSLKQMVSKQGVWYLDNQPYTGRYIDYYNNGRLQNEGTLLNGKIDGQLNVYYKTGVLKSSNHYKEGRRHGIWKDYYQNGALLRIYEFADGKGKGPGKRYFINGQLMQELKPKNATPYDTSVVYYSTGKVKKMKTSEAGNFYPDRKESDLNYYTYMFYQSLRSENLKEANKLFFEIWKLDSNSIESYYLEGLLSVREFRFDDAIALFDKALAIEPLLREALEQRALTRIKRFKMQNEKVAFKDRKHVALQLQDIMLMPEDEEEKACTDILLGDQLDPGFQVTNKPVPAAILNYCKGKGNR